MNPPLWYHPLLPRSPWAWTSRAVALAAPLLAACGGVPAETPADSGETADASGWYGDTGSAPDQIPPWDAWNSAEATALEVSAADSAIAAAIALPCGGASAKPDGSCCPAGQAWDQWTKACGGFALAECPDPLACRPKWCATLASGPACASGGSGASSCTLAPRSCSPGELQDPATCLAGEFPDGATCRAAGSGVHLPGGSVAAAELPASPSPALAAPEELRVSYLADGSAPPDLALCAPGDATPVACSGCQVGEAQDPSGTCLPLEAFLPAPCPPGFAVDLANPASCAADPGDCDADPFAQVEDSEVNWFVDPAFAGEPTGKRAAPFATLGEALQKASAGSTIALAAGAHALPKGETLVGAGIALRGRCAALTSLQLPQGKAETSLVVAGSLEGIAVVGGSVPLTLQNGGSARRTSVGQGNWAGLRCSSCSLERVVVGGPGRGIAFDPGEAKLQQVRVFGAVGRGLDLAAGATVTADDLAIRATQAAQNGGGYGILLDDGARLSARGLRVSGCAAAAVGAYHAGTQALLSFAELSQTAASGPSGEGGHGVLASGGAEVTLTHGRLQGNQGVGALAWGKGSVLTLINATVSSTQAAPDQGSGDGARAQNGGRIVLRAVHLVGNRTRGALATGAGSQLVGQRAVIQDTLPRQADALQGHGVAVEQGASASLQGVRLQGNHSAAAVVSGANSQLTLSQAVVAGVLPRAADGAAGYGVEVSAGGRAQLKQIHVSRARAAAVVVSGPGSSAVILQAWLTEVQPRASDERPGRGLVVRDGAAALVAGLGVFAATDAGIAVEAAQLQAQDVWVAAPAGAGSGTGSGASSGAGRGAEITLGGQALLRRVRLSGSPGVALAVSGTSTAADIAELLVDSGAVQVSAQASLALRGFRLWQGGLPGLLAADAGTRLDAADGQLSGLDQAPELRSFGAVALGGATLSLSGAQIAHCRGAGVLADRASVALNGVAIIHSAPLANGSGGAGVHVSQGHALLWGSQLSANRGAALAAVGSQVELLRCAASGSLPQIQTGGMEFADGLVLVDGLEARIKDCVVAANPRIGLLIQGGSLLAIGLRLHANGFAWGVQGLAQVVTNAAVLADNAQNVWTGPALPWLQPPAAPSVAAPLQVWAP